MKIRGRVWKFGDSISTDDITPGRFFHLRSNLSELSKHTLEDVREEFAKNVKQGDIVVGGMNFGLGSSREHAARVFKVLGVSCIIAKCFSRIFFRNCINIGLPVIELKEADEVTDGNILDVDLENGILKNETTGKVYNFPKLPSFVLKIINTGGIEEMIKGYGDIEV
ncbi:MAG: 3-isopropylmalate dehydratase small subunit [Candidatus Marinimicrobia bacterium]|nr:3-isopropylmalate dehydratase small subunit [Candidatus Neomarinimicrobiota bacterium]